MSENLILTSEALEFVNINKRVTTDNPERINPSLPTFDSLLDNSTTPNKSFNYANIFPSMPNGQYNIASDKKNQMKGTCSTG